MFSHWASFLPAEIYKTVKTSSVYATSPSEALHHVNYLEMLAVLLALRAFKAHLEGKQVGVMIDDTTAVQHLPIWVQATRYCLII